MILYLDTSALVTLFVTEPESDVVAEKARSVATHVIAYAGMCAALARAVWMGSLAALDLGPLRAECELFDAALREAAASCGLSVFPEV